MWYRLLCYTRPGVSKDAFFGNHFVMRITGIRERDTAQDEISCFHDYGLELALSLFSYLEIGRNHRRK